jgi:hypothetical protein
MEAAPSLVRWPVSNRVVGCLWCHQASTHSEVVRNHGLCQACAEEMADLAWRVVYDRDLKIGSIPANLRLAYRL